VHRENLGDTGENTVAERRIDARDGGHEYEFETKRHLDRTLRSPHGMLFRMTTMTETRRKLLGNTYGIDLGDVAQIYTERRAWRVHTVFYHIPVFSFTDSIYVQT